MSDEDGNPNDGALERGDTTDLSSLNGYRGHGPKLSTQSRAINPRALLQAEAEGQSRDHMNALNALGQAQGVQAGQALRGPYVDPYAHVAQQAPPRPHSTLPRGMPAVRPPLPPMRQPAPPPPPNDDARAWDAYASAALQHLSHLAGQYDTGAIIEHATFIADELLEQRRRRFP